MLALDLLLPGLDLTVDLLVEVRHRAGDELRTPQDLGNIFDPPHRDASEVHLDRPVDRRIRL